jgi:hypothetical protein
MVLNVTKGIGVVVNVSIAAYGTWWHLEYLCWVNAVQIYEVWFKFKTHVYKL